MLITRFSAIAVLLYTLGSSWTLAQNEPVVVTSNYFNERGFINLESAYGWQYLPGGGTDQVRTDSTDSGWMLLRPNELSLQLADDSGIIDGWFRLRFEVDSTLANVPLRLLLSGFGAATVYLDGLILAEYGNPSDSPSEYRAMVSDYRSSVSVQFVTGKQYDLLIRYRDTGYVNYAIMTLHPNPPYLAVVLTNEEYYALAATEFADYTFFAGVWLTGITLLMLLFLLFFYQNSQLTSLKLIAISTAFLAASAWLEQIQTKVGGLANWIFEFSYYLLLATFVGLVPMVVSYLIRGYLTRITWVNFIAIVCITPILVYIYDLPGADYGGYYLMGLVLAFVFGYSFFIIIQHRRSLTTSQKVVVAGLALTLFWMLLHTLFISLGIFSNYYRLFTVAMIYLSLPISFLGYVSIQFNDNLRTVQRNLKEISELTSEKLRVQAEKQELIESQNILLEHQVKERTQELTERNEELVVARDHLQQAIENLKSTQEQLIQQEKLASLGQLTAGIAHEIKNPLNFVNNFSQVSIELVDELKEALDKSDIDEAKWIAGDLGSNMERIHEHGSRADGIVQSMLMHSRSSAGNREPVNFNAIVKEYVNLALQGMRASVAPFVVDVVEEYDPSVGQVPVVVEDFSRVVINICNNAFDAMRGMVQGSGIGDQGSGTTPEASNFFKDGAVIPTKSGPSPQVTDRATAHLYIRTNRNGNRVSLEIEDNGPGIPDDVKDKILQPFFTTKKGTQGTGLGLSITHDIIKAHGGELTFSSEPGRTVFTILI